MGKMREMSDKVSEFTDKYGIANPIEVADEAMGGQTREESKARREKLKEQPGGMMATEKVQPGGMLATEKPAKKAEEFNLHKTVKKAADKNEGMKKGGKVKSASSRADGCAIRGKTRA
jgi:hypothetical protein